MLSVWGVAVFTALLLIGGIVRAQELSVLSSFASPTSNAVATPNSSLVEDSSGNFYGTTSAGGTANRGTVYKIAPGGTITLLHSFGATAVPTVVNVAGGGTLPPGSSSGLTVADGSNPSGKLILASDGNLYGTTEAGGQESYGCVYVVSPAGGYSILHSFTDRNTTLQAQPDLSLGAYPVAGVIQGKDGYLYGTTMQGGDAGLGTIFKLKLDGTLTVIHDFETGGDAASPAIGLVQDTLGNLYGATGKGGTAGSGAVYQLSSQNIYSVIYSFPAAATSYTFTLTSAYGANGLCGYSPNSALAIGIDGNLYGTAADSMYGAGAVYQVTPAGHLTFLHYFGDGSVVAGDGAEPSAAIPFVSVSPPAIPQVADSLVVVANGNFYGATYSGGAGKAGTIFQMTPAGQVTIIHSFGDGTVANDGAQPIGLIAGADGNFYGTTRAGGTAGSGTAFTITSALPLITSPLQVIAAANVPFSYSMTATQGPDTFTVGALPSGFSFDGTSIISATPTLAGKFTVLLTATNAAGSTTVPLTITVLAPPAITSLLDVVGSTTSLGYQIFATGNPTSFAATGLPPGVSVDPANGFFYGAPTAAGTYQVTVSATNAVGTGSAVVSIDILSSAPTADQEYMQIHSFQDSTVAGEGSFPGAMILGKDTNLYGVTAQGGAGGDGTIFKLSPAGVATVVATFNGTNGAEPQGVIQTADGTLYGTARNGGSTANAGTIFKVTPDGTITVLHTFGVGTVTKADGTTATVDGANPQAGLVLGTDGNFYGTTQLGGSANFGTVFQMTPAGVVTILHSFGDGTVANDGEQPVAALVQVTKVGLGTLSGPPLFFGTTLQGGTVQAPTSTQDPTSAPTGNGTVFSITSAGTVNILHSFGLPSSGDGELPRAALTATPNAVYGTTSSGGSIGKGTIFSISPLGISYAVLHNFGDGTVAGDGENPGSALVALPLFANVGGQNIYGSLGAGLSLSGVYLLYSLPPMVLYGTTQNGGTAGSGTVFAYNTGNSPTLTVLHNSGDSAFANDGTIPLGGLCFGADGNLYGTTIGGGSGSGTAYGIEINQGSSHIIPTAPPFTFTGTLPAGLTFDPITGTFAGTPLLGDAAGVYTLTVTPAAGGLGAAPVAQTITIKLNQTYSSWTAEHPPAPTSVVGTNGNTGAGGSDNVPMVLKYLVGVDPSKPLQAADYAALPTIGMDSTSQPGNSFLVLTWRQSAAATGVGVALYSTTDMQTWSLVSGDNLISQPMGTDASGNTMMEMGVKMTGAAQQFIRLQVTPPTP